MTLRTFGRTALAFIAAGHLAAAWAQSCPGDCDGNQRVSAAEITRLVALILLCDGVPSGCPAQTRSCLAGDADGNGRIEVPDLVAAIQNVLRYNDGCPPAPTVSPTPSSQPLTPSVSPTQTATYTATAGATATVSPTASPTATATASPTPLAAVCGNGQVEPGESCDDGNQVTAPPQDICPADCRIETCSPSEQRFVVSVQFSGGTNIASIATLIEYPDGVVQLPGTASDASVGSRVTNRPSGFLADWFDFDFALRVALVGSRALSGNPLYRVSFDLCRGVQPPAPTDFACRVLEANDTSFQPVGGVTCTVVPQ